MNSGSTFEKPIGDRTERTKQFDQYRPLLFSIAYRMLGSVMDAEDMVQETFVKWEETREQVQSPKAYLTTILTHLCLDRLRSAQRQREQYVGPWLPEPLLTTGDATMAETAQLAESLSVAFLVLLETLAPIERAAFILHEAFDYPYEDIAGILGKSEANVRQIVHRAKQHVTENKPRFKTTPSERDQITRRFEEACTNGDMEQLISLLAPDVVFRGDGGGQVPAAPQPIYGAARVAHVVVTLMAKAPPNYVIRMAEVNRQPAFIGYLDGRPFNVLSFEIIDGRVQNMYNVMNPDKLTHIPPLASLG